MARGFDRLNGFFPLSFLFLSSFSPRPFLCFSPSSSTENAVTMKSSFPFVLWLYKSQSADETLRWVSTLYESWPPCCSGFFYILVSFDNNETETQHRRCRFCIKKTRHTCFLPGFIASSIFWIFKFFFIFCFNFSSLLHFFTSLFSSFHFSHFTN